MISTIAQLNALHRKHWQAQKALRQRCVAAPSVAEFAFENWKSETTTGFPFKYWKSMDYFLAQADRAKRRFGLAHKGGRAKKIDPLQGLILEIVRPRPTVTVPELLELLRRRQWEGIIQDIDEGSILFTTRDGRSKSAPVSGLKDRLSRAKRSLRLR